MVLECVSKGGLRRRGLRLAAPADGTGSIAVADIHGGFVQRAHDSRLPATTATGLPTSAGNGAVAAPSDATNAIRATAAATDAAGRQ